MGWGSLLIVAVSSGETGLILFVLAIGIVFGSLLLVIHRFTPTMKTITLYSTGLEISYEPDKSSFWTDKGFYHFATVKDLKLLPLSGKLILRYPFPKNSIIITNPQQLETVKKACEAVMNSAKEKS